MTDSFSNSVPGIRDGNQMVVGGREVSREVVAKSLEDNEIVMLVPGPLGDNMKFLLYLLF